MEMRAKVGALVRICSKHANMQIHDTNRQQARPAMSHTYISVEVKVTNSVHVDLKRLWHTCFKQHNWETQYAFVDVTR